MTSSLEYEVVTCDSSSHQNSVRWAAPSLIPFSIILSSNRTLTIWAVCVCVRVAHAAFKQTFRFPMVLLSHVRFRFQSQTRYWFFFQHRQIRRRNISQLYFEVKKAPHSTNKTSTKQNIDWLERKRQAKMVDRKRSCLNWAKIIQTENQLESSRRRDEIRCKSFSFLVEGERSYHEINPSSPQTTFSHNLHASTLLLEKLCKAKAPPANNNMKERQTKTSLKMHKAAQ